MENQKNKKPLLLIESESIPASVNNADLEELNEGLKSLNIHVEDVDSGKIKSPKNAQLLKSADLILCFSPDSKILKQAMKEGVVPVIFQKTDTKNSSKINRTNFTPFNPNTEQGNCFTFQNLNKWEIFTAVVKALETYKFPYDWKNIVRQVVA